MVGVFVDQYMRQQARTRTAAFDGARWQRCLCEGLTARTCKSWAHDTIYDEPTGNVLQLFGDVLAEATQPTAALGAIVVARGQLDFHARDMIWDRAALGFVFWFFVGKTQLCRHLCDSYLADLQCQLKLLDAF